MMNIVKVTKTMLENLSGMEISGEYVTLADLINAFNTQFAEKINTKSK